MERKIKNGEGEEKECNRRRQRKQRGDKEWCGKIKKKLEDKELTEKTKIVDKRYRMEIED